MTLQKLNILNCLHRSDFGGAHWRVVWVAKRLNKQEVNTYVFYPKDSSSHYESYLMDQDIECRRMRFPVLRRRILTWLIFLITIPWVTHKISRLVKKEQINIIHANGVTNLQPVLAGIISRTPVLWHWNDMLTPIKFVSLAKQIAKSDLVQIAVATKAITQFYSLQAYNPILIPAPIGQRPTSDNSLKQGLREELSLNSKSQLIGFLGHLTAEKGLQDFIEIALRLLPQHSELNAVVIGGALSNHQKFYDEIIEKVGLSGYSDRIHMVGYRTDATDLLKDLDLFVLSSKSEACPISVLEAMREGIPIVSTKVGEVPLMLKGTDCPLTDISDIEAMHTGSTKMLKLNDCEKQKMADRMRVNLKKYSTENVSEIHLNTYKLLAQQYTPIF